MPEFLRKPGSIMKRFQINRLKTVAAVALVASSVVSIVSAQGSRADYERAAGLSRRFQGKVFRDRVEAHWLSNNTQFWYEVRTGTNTHEFVFVDAEKGERRPAFNHARLAQALEGAGAGDVRAENLALRNVAWRSANEMEFGLGGKYWRVNLADYFVTEETNVARGGSSVAISPE